jgi:excisionase family DNA binding protein
MPELMTVREVAEYLRLKERKVYDLVATGLIPCTRVTGKWLFSKTLIDLWIIQNTACRTSQTLFVNTPKVIAGSHDPLLEWAVRESGGDLALLFNGSLDGLTRMAAREVLACALHVFDAVKKSYNVELVAQTLAGLPVVALEWAWREQGLIVAAGNPFAVTTLADLLSKGVRFVDRQPEAGSHLLLNHLLTEEGLALADLNIDLPPARNETEVALAVLAGKADVGFGIAAVARQFRLGFIPLQRERYDLIVGRRDYFEPPFQHLLEFTRSERFRERAAELGGYDIANLGRVVYNAP